MKMVKGVKNQFKFANREYSETADMGKIGGHKPSKQIPTSFMDGPLKPKNCKGAFNIYVDKMRGGGGQKMSVFVHAQGIKTVHAGVGEGQKMAKFCPRSC